ncbi:hypothetical protein AB6A40_004540 [Gnathostoma spinigerum]|uniref:Uncharacterized protein n=1 Tax=Gnathostoma spinigerum TaxID=75299 RepID=A0ABD6EK82_9BILA
MTFILSAAIIFIFLGTSVSGLFGSMKNVTVKGQLGCGGKSYPNIKIQLWEDDTWGLDDLLNETTSARDGHFRVYGQTKEIRNIEPYLIIEHHCDNGLLNPQCKIRDRYDVPKEFQGRTYDMGIVSLNIASRKHKKYCD